MQQVSNRKLIREMPGEELEELMDEIQERNRGEWNFPPEDDKLFKEAFTQYFQITGKYYGILEPQNQFVNQ